MSRMLSSRSSARNNALFGLVQSPCHGKTIFFLLCLRSASAKSIVQHFEQNRVLFAKESGNSIRKSNSLPLCHQDYGSSRRKKGCMYCLLFGSGEGLSSDRRGLGSGLLKIYS